MERKGIVTMGGAPMTLLGDEIKVGDKAPDFTVLDSEMNPVKLSDAKGKTVVIAVFPSVDTSVCAAQTRRFNQEAANLENATVYTVSLDLPFALGRFCAAEGIENAKTLSDHRDLDFGMKYGFVMKEVRLLARGTVIVDPEGIVKYIEHVPEVTNHPDYEKAIEIAKSL